MTDDNLRVVLCPTCGSEGVLIYARGNDPDHERYEECPECEGNRVTLVEVEPIELDDLARVLMPTEAVDIIMTEAFHTGQCIYFITNDGKLFMLRDGEMEQL